MNGIIYLVGLVVVVMFITFDAWAAMNTARHDVLLPAQHARSASAALRGGRR